MQPQVITIGAGPAGLAAAACLNTQSIPNTILEREDCFASLWKKYSYDRLHLHLPKQICGLPYMSMPSSYPTYVPKNQFLDYMHGYVDHFNIDPLYQRSVEFASFDETESKWIVKAKNLRSGEVEEYGARFLVLATGETQDPFIPRVEGLESFSGEFFHSTKFKAGKDYKGKKVLVVGSGNSGMEIAFDLANHGATTSLVVRSPVHILSREMMSLSTKLFAYVPFNVLDSATAMVSKLYFGDLTKYGIRRPAEGPFLTKVKYNRYPIIDVGTCSKIKSGDIQVLPSITSIKGNNVAFEDGKSYPFDTIIFATGFKRSTKKWLKERGEDSLLDEDGFSRHSHWKGKDGLYCCGLSKRGLYGIGTDAENIANHIKALL